MNEVVRQLRKKGYTVGEFLIIINRGSTWWHTHKCYESKDYALLMLAIKGLEENNMKTVMDAINALKGEWPTKGDNYWKQICDTEQFSDLLIQLETNFGECYQSYSKYKRLYVKWVGE